MRFGCLLAAFFFRVIYFTSMTDLSYLKEINRRAAYDNDNAFRYQFWVNPCYYEAGRFNLCRADGIMPLLDQNILSVPVKPDDKYLLPGIDASYAYPCRDWD